MCRPRSIHWVGGGCGSQRGGEARESPWSGIACQWASQNAEDPPECQGPVETYRSGLYGEGFPGHPGEVRREAGCPHGRIGWLPRCPEFCDPRRRHGAGRRDVLGDWVAGLRGSRDKHAALLLRQGIMDEVVPASAPGHRPMCLVRGPPREPPHSVNASGGSKFLAACDFVYICWVCIVQPLHAYGPMSPVLEVCSPKPPLLSASYPDAAYQLAALPPESSSDAVGGFEAWVSQLLAYLTFHLQCCIRSALLLYFLAVSHCFARAIPIKKSHPHRNSGVRGARLCLRGAPVWLALGLVAHLLPLGHAVQLNRPQYAGLYNSAPASSSTAAVPPEQPCATDPRVWNNFTASSAKDDLLVQVQVFRLQRSTLTSQQWVGPHEGIPFLCQAVHDDLFIPGQDCCVMPVCPQPSTDFIALIESPPWLTRSLRIPVLIEVHPAPVSRFVEVCVGRVTLEDLRAAVGDKLAEGGAFFVGASKDPLQHDDVISPRPGTLFRFFPQHVPCRTCVPLEAKIQRPAAWFRPWAQDIGATDLHRGGIGLVGPWGDWSCDGMTAKGLRHAISRSCGLPVSSLLLAAPASDIRDLFFRGDKIASVLSVMSRALDGACVVFVDARDLGVPVRALALPPCAVHVDELLRLAGGDRPLRVPVSVAGATRYNDEDDTLIPVHKEVIRFRVIYAGALGAGAHQLRPGLKQCDENLSPCMSGSASDVTPDAAPMPSSGQPALSAPLPSLHEPSVGHATRATASNACVPAPAVSDPPAALAETSLSAQSDPQPRRSCMPLQCRKRVRSPNPPVPARAPASARARRGSPEVQALHAGAFHAGDFRPGPRAGEDEGGESEQPVSDSSPEFQEFRLPVRLINFQRADSYHSLCTAVGESLEDFLTRARILLHDEEEPHELLVPDPQPTADFLTVLSAPVWWQRKGLNLVLVAGGHEADADYAVISRHGVTFPQLLPPPRDGSERRVDLYNTGPVVTASGDIQPGTMLFMQRVGASPPVLPAVSHLFASPALDGRESQLPRPQQPAPMGYLLLDSVYGQHPISLNYGPVVPQIASVVQHAPSEIMVWFQNGPSGIFGPISAYGTVVNRCLAFRHRDVLDTGHGPMLFIDARCLGKPICSRIMRSYPLRVEDFLEALDFSLPGTMRPASLEVCQSAAIRMSSALPAGTPLPYGWSTSSLDSIRVRQMMTPMMAMMTMRTPEMRRDRMARSVPFQELMLPCRQIRLWVHQVVMVRQRTRLAAMLAPLIGLLLNSAPVECCHAMSSGYCIAHPSGCARWPRSWCTRVCRPS